MANETQAAEEFLFDTLDGDATLSSLGNTGVYSETAPDAATEPYTVFREFAPRGDARAVDVRIMARLQYLVEVVVRAESYSSAKDIYDRVDDLLELTTGSNSYGDILLCRRVRPANQIEIEDGRQYRRMGGIYLLHVQGA